MKQIHDLSQELREIIHDKLVEGCKDEYKQELISAMFALERLEMEIRLNDGACLFVEHKQYIPKGVIICDDKRNGKNNFETSKINCKKRS